MIPENAEIEERLLMEIVVDAYNESERAVGWHCYLDDRLEFPFLARIEREAHCNPLPVGEMVTALALDEPDGDCHDGFWVSVKSKIGKFDLPLEQLEPIDANEDTAIAAADWKYWVDRGYTF